MRSPNARLLRRLTAATAALVASALVAVAPPSHAEGGALELNLGSLAPKGTPWMDMLVKIEKQIETDSAGQINVIIRPPGVMGEVEMVRETRKGERLQGCAVTTAAIAEGAEVPLLNLIELPFLLKTNAEADQLLDNVLWEPFSEQLAKQGLVLATWSEHGWRSFGTKGSGIHTVDDVKNFKMRAQESPVQAAMYKAFGATAVQKPMTEVVAALQADEIDGLDGTALYLQSAGLAESLETFTLSRHSYQPAALVISKSWYDELPPALKPVVLKARALAAESREAIREEEQAMLENMELLGIELIELDDDARKGFAAKAQPIHDSYAATIDGGPAMLGKIKSGLATLRK